MPKGKKCKVGKLDFWLRPENLLRVQGWASDYLKDDEISKKMHICQTTFYKWKRTCEPFKKALENGRFPIDVEVENNFRKYKLNGHYVEETVKEITQTSDGNRTEHIKTTKRWIEPDTTAMIFYLKCRKPSKYNDRIAQLLSDETEDSNVEIKITRAEPKEKETISEE